MADEKPTPTQPPLPQHLPFLTLILLLLIAFYAFTGPVRAWFSGRYRAEATLTTALGIVLDEYVDPRSPDDLVQGAINGLVESLDDHHSLYLTPMRNQRLEETEQGHYVGLGIEIGIRPKDQKVYLVRVFDGSPAQRAGLKAGDVLLAATEHDPLHIQPARTRDLAGMPLQEVSNLLRGAPGSQVKLRILREGKEREVTVERGEVKRPVVEARLLPDAIGYLRIRDFPDALVAEVKSALEGLLRKDIRALVLDLRENNGGFLDQAVRVADLFIDSGVIVSTRGRHERDDRIYYATPNGIAGKLPMAALIDGGTASAAEVLAGALRDHGRATLVGTRSYGKGVVNKRFPLPDESGILLTTGRYYLPNGEEIEGKGLKPDRLVEPPSAAELENLPQGAKRPDPQLDAAVKLLKDEPRAAETGSGEPGG